MNSATSTPQQRDPTADGPLAVRIARSIVTADLRELPAAAIDKVKVCLFDLVGCAFESRELPWSRQAAAIAHVLSPGATLIGATGSFVPGDAAFANAVMGHGLVREDMHAGSVSHLGIVVLPTLLALAQTRSVSGSEFILAAILGYEVGGRVGRAAMDPDIARIHRPTGIAGPIGAAAAGARLLGLDVTKTTSAIALATNTTAGFNQWAHTGGSEMWFEAGFAARNGLSAVELARAGAFASPSALDGEAGLFASLRKREAAERVSLFADGPEILTVYHKPVPACNFAQTPCQAALALTRRDRIDPAQVASIDIRVPRAGALYPGCDSRGPFEHVLQAKMSIQFNVAAALLHGESTERNFSHLDDPRLRALLGLTHLTVDDDMTRTYPRVQGGEVAVRLRDGRESRVRLDDVVHASAADVRARFREAVAQALGNTRAAEVESFIDGLEDVTDAGHLGSLLAAPAAHP